MPAKKRNALRLRLKGSSSCTDFGIMGYYELGLFPRACSQDTDLSCGLPISTVLLHCVITIQVHSCIFWSLPHCVI